MQIDKNSGVFSNNLKTIAFLCENTHDPSTINIWRGVRQEALRRNINAVCVAGGHLEKSPYNEWEYQRNALYKLLSSKTIDGIIINGTLPIFGSPSTLKSILSQFKEIATVTVGAPIEQIPSVCIDNKPGTQSLVNHLVDCHGYKEFAYIQGPQENPESISRLQLFLSSLKQRGIEPDKDLVVGGMLDKASGFYAAENLIARGKKIDVIVAANDCMAVGALEYLAQKGIKVPKDIAVCGFDNSDEGMFVTPPVTTVCMSFSEVGAAAVQSLYGAFKGTPQSLQLMKSSELLVRRSCGCFQEPVSGALPEEVDIFRDDYLVVAHYIKELQEKSSIWSDTIRLSELLEILTEFHKSIRENKPELFLFTLEGILADQLKNDYAIVHWGNILKVIKEKALLSDLPGIGAMVESLIGKATVMLALCASKAQGNYRMKLVKHEAVITKIKDAAGKVIGAAEFDLFMDTMVESVPAIGISSGYLCFYDPYGQDEQLRIHLAFGGDNEKRLTENDGMFSSCDLLPAGSMTGYSAQACMILPIYFRDNSFGYMVFNDGALEYSCYEKLADCISTSLYSMRQVTRIEEAHRDLQIMQEKEHEYLQTITRELETGRKIQKSFLPSTLPELQGWRVAEAFVPSAQISGDFYDVYMLDETKMIVAIGDVCGKNVGAALLMALIRTLNRVIVEHLQYDQKDPLAAVSAINDYMHQHHSNSIVGQMFVTLFVGCVDIETGSFEYVNAGHLYPLIINKAGEVSRLKTSGPAVGIAPDISYRKYQGCIGKNELLFMYTDGVTDARDEHGTLFERDAMMTVLVNPALNVQEKITDIITRLRKHSKCESLFDDVTMLGVERY